MKKHMIVFISLVAFVAICEPIKSMVGYCNSIKYCVEDDSLPYDAEVEYLEGDGYSYIVLPFNCGNNLDFKFSATILESNGYVFGAYHTWSQSNPPTRYCCALKFSQLGVSNGRADMHIGQINTIKETYTSGTLSKNKYVECILSQSLGVLCINDWNTSLPSTNVADVPYDIGSVPMGLFTAFNGRLNSPISIMKIRIHSFQAYSNGALILDLIPVRINDVGCMYDAISGHLFGNSGTGSFILGPDKVEDN